MTIPQLLFYLFALVTCASAIAVVVSQNVVRMAFWLIVSLGSLSGLFFMAHADFVGATQLIVYVGGTLVLLVFGVMLTASGSQRQLKMSPADGFLAAGIGIVFIAIIMSTVLSVDWNGVSKTLSGEVASATTPDGYNKAEQGNTIRTLGLGFLGVRADKDLGAKEGKKISVGYLLPFEIVSVHLLVVLIGAAYLARAKRKVEPRVTH